MAVTFTSLIRFIWIYVRLKDECIFLMLQIFNRWRCILYDLNIKFGYFWDTLCTTVTVLGSVGRSTWSFYDQACSFAGFGCHACRVMPSVACLWILPTCNDKKAIVLAAPVKLVVMEQKEITRQENKIKEFSKQLSKYPWKFRIL